MIVPQHIAVIMDGNGRWAKARGKSRSYGHIKGARRMEEVVINAKKKGIKALTIFCISSENWTRPAAEVQALIRITKTYLESDLSLLEKEKIRICFMGEFSRLPNHLVDRMKMFEEKTKNFDGMQLFIALGYGSRIEIVSAAKKIVDQVQEGKISPDDINIEMVSNALPTGCAPPLDLLIRASGEQRLSNFMLWEAAYAELYWAPAHWPDFGEKELDEAIEIYGSRDRRFGKV